MRAGDLPRRAGNVDPLPGPRRAGAGAPLGRDQAFNAGRIEDLGAGIALPADAPPRRIRAAVETLLSDQSFRAGAERAAGRIASDRPDRAAVEALERCASA